MKFGVFDHLDRNELPLADFYEQRLDFVEQFDRLGFYSYHLAEHHGTPLGLVPSPYNDILDKTAKTMMRIAHELGFSPAARPRLEIDPVDPDPEHANPWAMLRVVPGGKSA